MTGTSSSTALAMVMEYHWAWTSGDIDLAMTYVTEDIVCHAPGADLIGKDAYRGYLAEFAPSLTGLSDIARFADGDHVALFYHPHTSTTSTAPAAECFTIRNGRIAESVLVFDRLSFAPPNQQ